MKSEKQTQLKGLKGKEIFEKMNRLGSQKKPFFFLIDYSKQNGLVLELNEIPDEIQYDFYQNSKKPNTKVEFKKTPEPFAVYKKKFDEIQKYLNRDLKVINLTCATPVETNLSLDEIFEFSNAKYKLLWKDHFVCFSPEIFVKIKDGKIYTYPMKGTIDASVENAEQSILLDPKEIEEHQRVVDLISDDLKKVSQNVNVKRFRYVDEVPTKDKTLLQVSSELEAEIGEDFHSRLGSIFDALLPGASICGSPKKLAMELIDSFEDYERNFYTGIFGIYDGKSLDSSVLIRFIEKTEKGLVYKSGGGITSKSKAEKEYNEMIAKVYVPFD